MASLCFTWFSSTFLALLEAVSASTCYSYSGYYSYYCSDGCCQTYSTYSGLYYHCCTPSSSDTVFIVVGAIAGFIMLCLFVFIAIKLLQHYSAKKTAVNPSTQPRSPSPIRVGTTVHQENTPAVTEYPQQPGPPPHPVQAQPPYGQMPVYSDPVYPPPPAYPYGAGP